MFFARAVLVRSHWAILFLLFFGLSPVLQSSEPIVRSINVRGLQVGGSTTLILDGDDLVGAKFLLPFPSKQELKKGSTDKKATIDVVLDAGVAPGIYQTWIASDAGISQPIVLGVDPLPQVVFAPMAEKLPIALHGAVAGSTLSETKFVGKAKQKVIVEVEAHRLGSKLRPIVHLYSPKKLQLAWAWGTPTLLGDARVEAVLPEDGPYTVTVHDAEYAAPTPSFFRLKIGEWSFADQVFPPAIIRGKAQKVELLGMTTPLSVDVPVSKETRWLPIALPKTGIWSGPRPFLSLSPHPEFVQQPPGGKMQELPEGPIGVSGRVLAPFDEDRYRLAVTPGKKVKLEVFAERIGAPLDASLVVRDEKGNVLVRADDSPGTLDPVLEYAVPDKVTAIVVGVVDSQGRAGLRSIYHLVVQPQTPAAMGAFTLSTTAQRIALPISGKSVLPVYIDRKGYAGKVDLTANLPAGVTMAGGQIPEGADGSLATIERTAAPFNAAIVNWVGRGAAGEEQPVAAKNHPLERLQPWLATEIAVAPDNAKAADFVVDWGNLPADAGLVPGNKLVLPIKATRTKDKTTVKLTALTSQVTPLVNNVPDPIKALRQEKPIEIAVNLPTGDVTLIVPPELSAPVYDVTVQAELLAADKKVIATTFAPVRRMLVRPPLFLALTGPNRVETVIDPKKGPVTLKIVGKVDRREGFKGDVAVAVAGLPAGVTAAPVTVPAAATDFAVSLVLPATQPAGEITGLKVSASAGIDTKQPNLRVKSKDVDFTLVVKVLK